LLVSGCVGERCGMASSDEDRGMSRRPGVEDQGWSHRSGTRCRMIERSGDVMCGLYRVQGDEKHGFLG
jgi:hypothetical protein